MNWHSISSHLATGRRRRGQVVHVDHLADQKPAERFLLRYEQSNKVTDLEVVEKISAFVLPLGNLRYLLLLNLALVLILSVPLLLDFL